jgi:hypothetical protein
VPSLSSTCLSALRNAEAAVASFTSVGVILVEAAAEFAVENYPVGLGLLAAAAVEARKFSVAGADAINQAISCIRGFLASFGGRNVACASTHKTSIQTQGPGVCCAALTAANIPPAVGVRVSAVNKLGKCIICEVTTSRSPKHPGQLVFKRGKASVPGSAVSCPSTFEGCCALSA